MVNVELTAAPAGVTVDGVKLQLVPLGQVMLRVTVWLNPPTGVTVTVAVAGVPVLTGEGESAVALIVKD
jgi:hypothetical protein